MNTATILFLCFLSAVVVLMALVGIFTLRLIDKADAERTKSLAKKPEKTCPGTCGKCRPGGCHRQEP